MGHVSATEADIKPSIEGQSVGFMRGSPVEGDSRRGLGALMSQWPFYKKGQGLVLAVSMGEGPKHFGALLSAS